MHFAFHDYSTKYVSFRSTEINSRDCPNRTRQSKVSAVFSFPARLQFPPFAFVISKRAIAGRDRPVETGRDVAAARNTVIFERARADRGNGASPGQEGRLGRSARVKGREYRAEARPGAAVSRRLPRRTTDGGDRGASSVAAQSGARDLRGYS